MNVVHMMNGPIKVRKEFITKSFRLRRPALTRTWNARLGWPHFGSNSPMYVAKFQSNARGMPGWGGGGMGGFEIDWYIRMECPLLNSEVHNPRNIRVIYIAC